MADDRHYVPGDNYLLDDISGMKIRASKAQMIPGGQTGNLWVDPSRWEAQQPQDFVTGVRDDQTVPISRPRQQNRFTIVGGQVMEAAGAGATAMVLDTVLGFTVGAVCQVVLDNGNTFRFTTTGIAGTTLTFAGQPLPSAVGGAFGEPLENAVIQIPS